MTLAYFVTLPDDEQISLLLSKVEEIKTGQSVYSYPIELWKAGNHQTFEEWIYNTYLDDENSFGDQRLESFVETMLIKRNQLMADRIIEFLSSEDENHFFVIAGAAHFFGEKILLKF
ncbi:TraB/GumN family protein [Alkalihalobacterium sp. APHAB7]|uniref:TraB/GumN family protein n=1 Tax=Alkalihalobacterium sp. APHAB7 TaxID=3402081 RepID=UPI003AAAC07D